MRKLINTKKLPLFSIVDLNKLLRENQLEDAELTDFSVGWNNNIYLLFEQSSGHKNEERLKTPSVYTVVEIMIVVVK